MFSKPFYEKSLTSFPDAKSNKYSNSSIEISSGNKVRTNLSRWFLTELAKKNAVTVAPDYYMLMVYMLIV